MKTSKLILPGLLAMLLSAIVPSAHGMSPGTLNEAEHTRAALGVDLVAHLPVGDFADAVGFGLGALARYEHHLGMSPLALTARAGYVWHLEKEADVGPSTVATNYSQIPLLAGLKYSLSGAPIYIGAEAGAVIAMTDVETSGLGGGSSSDTETNFAWTAGAGYELGPTDIRLFLNFPDASNMADVMTIGVSLGYNFWGM